MPGMTPPIKRSFTETVIGEQVAKTTMKRLGGMIGPRRPPAASITAVKSTSYPRLRISGSIIEERAAVDADPEPVIAANPAPARTVIRRRLPVTHPTTALVQSIMRRAIPPLSISCPARTKNGIAIRGKLSRPAIMRIAIVFIGISMRYKNAAETVPIAKTIGVPLKIATTKRINIRANIILLPPNLSLILAVSR